ncbi:MAG: hypothetical protein KGL48_05960 [Sphingomonadales bacterium]|nr:hypothetical protein [Sphingomonadales bacterium]MDE2568922.1 hypothetical protein [Sphingomonadales bacterium]
MLVLFYVTEESRSRISAGRLIRPSAETLSLIVMSLLVVRPDSVGLKWAFHASRAYQNEADLAES